jgi:hypothetical protein
MAVTKEGKDHHAGDDDKDNNGKGSKGSKGNKSGKGSSAGKSSGRDRSDNKGSKVTGSRVSKSKKSGGTGKKHTFEPTMTTRSMTRIFDYCVKTGQTTIKKNNPDGPLLLAKSLFHGSLNCRLTRIRSAKMTAT